MHSLSLYCVKYWENTSRINLLWHDLPHPLGQQKSHLKGPRCCAASWGPCADSCQSEKHPEWTQNKKTSFFKKYYSSTKCNDHKLKALSSLAQYHNRFTWENKIGHPSFTLYIHLFSVHALAHREGSMVQVWKIFLGETNHLASCSLANGVCNFLYLQQKKNKVTQNRPPQIFKEAKLLKCGTSCNLFFYPVWNMSGLPKALNIHTWK